MLCGGTPKLGYRSLYYLTASVSQESGHSLVGFSGSGLCRLSSGLHLDCSHLQAGLENDLLLSSLKWSLSGLSSSLTIAGFSASLVVG